MYEMPFLFCVAWNTWSLAQASLWNYFKEHFQLQEEKECLDRKKN